MKRESIPFDEFALPIFHTWGERWFLVTAGTAQAGRFNTMTAAWGSIGVMWEKPYATVAVRPSRYTFEFLERSPDFTLCAFPASFRDKLMLCGTKSGRTTDKVKECGFTVRASQREASPSFDEAELILECRKMYTDDFVPQRFLDPKIESNYGGADYHRLYYGEILAIHATPEYRRGR